MEDRSSPIFISTTASSRRTATAVGPSFLLHVRVTFPSSEMYVYVLSAFHCPCLSQCPCRPTGAFWTSEIPPPMINLSISPHPASISLSASRWDTHPARIQMIHAHSMAPQNRRRARLRACWSRVTSEMRPADSLSVFCTGGGTCTWG